MEVKEVEIPSCEKHEGFHRIKVKLNWNRTEEGRCRILCNTDFKDNDCSFYKSKQGGKKNEV